MRYEKLTYDKMNFLTRMNKMYVELLARADRERMALRQRIQRLLAENANLRRNVIVCSICHCQGNNPTRALFACGHVTCCDNEDPCVNGHCDLERCPNLYGQNSENDVGVGMDDETAHHKPSPLG